MNCFKSWNGANFQPQSWAVWWLSGRERMGNIEEDERTREWEVYFEILNIRWQWVAWPVTLLLVQTIWMARRWSMIDDVCRLLSPGSGLLQLPVRRYWGHRWHRHGLLQSVSSLFIIRICIRLRLRDHHPDWSIQLGLFLGIGNLITQDNW